MLVSMWSRKGGQGTSTTAALTALGAAQDQDRSVLLVDLGRDQPAIFGTPETGAGGLGAWSHSDLSAESLERSLEELTPNLSLLPKGPAAIGGQRAGELVEWLKRCDTVVVDAGTLDFDCDGAFEGSVQERVIAESDRSILVTRACYLSLRRTVALPARPSGVVLVAEQGRALTRSDCERAIGSPVLASVSIDPDIARAVDAGMLRTRVPKAVSKALGAVVEDDAARALPLDRSPAVELD